LQRLFNFNSKKFERTLNLNLTQLEKLLRLGKKIFYFILAARY
jgi:hypothetical protein